MRLNSRTALPILLLPVILLAGIWLYWPGTSGGLLFDDVANLEPLHDLDTGHAGWSDIIFSNDSGHFGRPVAMLSFVIDHVSSGGTVSTYKSTNILIHILCAVLLFWLCGRLLQETRYSDKRWLIAAWVAAMWLLTPIQVSTVLYIIQRMAQLATLFILAGLISYVAGRQNIEKRPFLGWTLIISCLLVWLPLAALSKENGLLLALLAFVIELYFFRFRLPVNSRRWLISLYIVLLAIPAVLAIIYLAIKHEAFLSAYARRDFTLTERLLTESRILFDYIRHLLIPDATTFGLFHDDYPVSRGLLNPATTLWSILAWVVVATLAITRYRKPAGIYFFPLVFFLAAHSMESSFFPLELYFEHRNYLASTGFYIGLGLGLFSLMHYKITRPYIAILLILLPVMHAISSYQRIQIWSSNDKILLNAIQNHPDSGRLHGNLAVYYMSHGRLDKARQHLDQAARINPRFRATSIALKIMIGCYLEKPVPGKLYSQLDRSLAQPRVNFPNEPLKAIVLMMADSRCKTLDIERFAAPLERWLLLHHGRAYRHIAWIGHVNLAQVLSEGKSLARVYRHLDIATRLLPKRLEPELLRLKYQIYKRDIGGASKTLAYIRKTAPHAERNYGKAIAMFSAWLEKLKATRQRPTSAPK